MIDFGPDILDAEAGDTPLPNMSAAATAAAIAEFRREVRARRRDALASPHAVACAEHELAIAIDLTHGHALALLWSGSVVVMARTDQPTH